MGPPRQIDVDAMGLTQSLWNYGDPYETFPIDTGRLANVAKLAAEQAGWGRPLPKGRGIGDRRPSQLPELCCGGREVEVASTTGHAQRSRGSISAVDCGLAVNPERIRSQMEGAWQVVRPASASPCSARSRFKNGRVEQSNYE